MLKELRARLKCSAVVYSHAEIHAMAEKLSQLANKSIAEKQQHIKDIQSKCPFCGSELVLRNGKYGQFWGCSMYPKCRFTKPLPSVQKRGKT